MRKTSICSASIVLAAALTALAAGPKTGDAAPAFSLQDQNGKPVKSSDFAGKIVVLEWFNDGCPFVRKQYAHGTMNTLASKYAKKDVVWLAINSSNFASTSHNREAASAMKIDRPILDDHTGAVGHAFGATNTPQMIVIDAKGNLAYSGAIDSVNSADPSDIDGATNYVAAALDDLLAGKPVATPHTRPYGCSVKYAGGE